MPRTVTLPSTHLAALPVHESYRILVGSDGDDSALGALRVAQALAFRKHATVHVLAVTLPFPHMNASAVELAPPLLIDEDSRHQAVERVRRQLSSIRGTADWTVEAVVGWPAEALLVAAERWPASIIILGIGEHGPLDRLIGSETAVAIARRSSIPLLAIPRESHALPTRALAAIDFTEASVAAATLAASLLDSTGTITLIHASSLVKPHAPAGSLPDLYTAGVTEKMRAISAHLHQQTKRHVDTVIVDGDLVDSMTEHVSRGECDLLALGGHDMGVLDRALLGSTRSRVLRHARCPVLIAPHAAAAER